MNAAYTRPRTNIETARPVFPMQQASGSIFLGWGPKF